MRLKPATSMRSWGGEEEMSGESDQGTEGETSYLHALIGDEEQNGR